MHLPGQTIQKKINFFIRDNVLYWNPENKMRNEETVMRKSKMITGMMWIAGAMMLTACGQKEETEPAVEEQTQAKTVTPLPSYLNLDNLGDCTIAVSFEKADLTEENAEFTLHVKAYDYELFDMVDIAALQVGDTLVIDGADMKIETLEKLDNGSLEINGGLENGGTWLWTNDDGVYYEIGFDDYKSYQEAGELTLPLAADFVFTDNADLENQGKTYSAEEFKNYLDADTEDTIFFVPGNCTITIVDGEIISMNREYMP